MSDKIYKLKKENISNAPTAHLEHILLTIDGKGMEFKKLCLKDLIRRTIDKTINACADYTIEHTKGKVLMDTNRLKDYLNHDVRISRKATDEVFNYLKGNTHDN